MGIVLASLPTQIDKQNLYCGARFIPANSLVMTSFQQQAYALSWLVEFCLFSICGRIKPAVQNFQNFVFLYITGMVLHIFALVLGFHIMLVWSHQKFWMGPIELNLWE